MSELRKGQTLKPIHAEVALREWGVSCDSVGAILCSYRVHIDRSHMAERVDVRFDDGFTVWGAPACEFTLVGETDDAPRKH
jgi:hypothetical protein